MIGWQVQTAPFYSDPEETHQFAHPALPFSTASCNTNDLIATGDESGSIRLIETTPNSRHNFSSTYLTFQPHTNAVMDLVFSPDDEMLATASGDQSSRIIDVRTQKTTFIMRGHTTSVKQVRFQPGHSNILATCSRDGTVQIWDTRTTGFKSVVRDLTMPTGLAQAGQITQTYEARGLSAYKSICDAHVDKTALSNLIQR
jgi:WD40 repeat protein